MAEPGVQRCKHPTVLFSNGADVTRDPSAANNAQTQVENEDDDEYVRRTPSAGRRTPNVIDTDDRLITVPAGWLSYEAGVICSVLYPGRHPPNL
jgi:hypothetical protein